MHVVLQPVPASSQAKLPEQGAGVPPTQLPLPSQLPPAVNVLPVHESDPQGKPMIG
jgi:hypothetical protein